MDDMHREVTEKSSASRARSIRSHNRKTGVHENNFDKGDYVLRGHVHRVA